MAKVIDQDRICVGVIVGSHGLQGSVKIKSFMVVSDDITAFGPLTDKNGERSFKLDLISSNKKGIVAKLSGITDRTASEELRGLELYLLRDLLPDLEEDEFYYSDLIGLLVENINGEIIGTVGMVDNYGAGEVLEVNLRGGGTEMYRVSSGVVPKIEIKNGRIVVNPPLEKIKKSDQDEIKTEGN